MSNQDQKVENTRQPTLSPAAENATNLKGRATPGPWIVDGAMIVPESAVKSEMGYQSGEYIAQCYPTLYKTIAGNLRLIAAAPDLLAALEEFQLLMERTACTPKWEKLTDYFLKIKAVVAKAKGE